MSTNSNLVQNVFAPQIGINELARDIAACGDINSFLVKGEPGCGKSSLLKILREIFSKDKRNYIYFDCAVKDVGDTWMNIPVHDRKRLEQYISDQFDFDNGLPFVVMLDEYMKAPKMLQVMFTRMVQERTVGDRPMPEGSIVFGTSNNESDGVGDTMLAHSANRLTIVPMRKPSQQEWLIWASNNGISGTMRAWAASTKSLFESYTTLDAAELDKNEYIFNPKKPRLSFVTPRSMEKSDNFVRNYKRLQDRVRTYIAGTMGFAAAQNLYAFILLEKELLTTKQVIADPLGCPLPSKTSAAFMMMFNAIDDLLTQDDLTQFMKFVFRIGHREVEGIFFTMLLQTKKTIKLARNNTTVMDWAAKNVELFA